MKELNQDLVNQVKAVLESLEQHVEGFYQCNCCYETFDSEEEASECCDDSAEYQGIYDYVCEALDINYILNADRSLRGVRLLVCFGGPNVWIDTESATIDGNWWGDKYSVSLSNDLVNELDSVCI